MSTRRRGLAPLFPGRSPVAWSLDGVSVLPSCRLTARLCVCPAAELTPAAVPFTVYEEPEASVSGSASAAKPFAVYEEPEPAAPAAAQKSGAGRRGAIRRL